MYDKDTLVNKVLTREDGERTLREIQLKKQIKSSVVSNLETRVSKL